MKRIAWPQERAASGGADRAVGLSGAARMLARLVDVSRRQAVMVVLGGILLAAGSGFYASRHLSLNTDTDQMFSASLPWRQHAMAMERAFPQFQGLLVAVIDAKVPEEAEETADDLQLALSQEHALFSLVSRPGSSPYFSKEGLLFLSPSELSDLMSRIIDAQPFLGTLSADPTARGLFSALELLGQGVRHGGADLGPYRGELAAFHAAMAAVLANHPQTLSSQQMLSGDLGDLGGKYQIILLKPRLNYHSLQPGGAATAAIRTAAASFPWCKVVMFGYELPDPWHSRTLSSRPSQRERSPDLSSARLL